MAEDNEVRRSAPLAGLHAVVTGGGTGLGFATAKAMCDAGATVTILGRRAEKLAQAVEELGSRADCLVADISATSEVDEIARQVDAIAPVDILVNNAGTHHKQAALETSDADFERVVATNLFGTFSITRAIAAHMARRNTGSIIMITSMAAIFGIPLVPAYSASKAALGGLSRQLAVEFGPLGIRVNAIAPGFIETDMNRDIFRQDPERLDKVLGRTPLGCLGRPEDVAETAVFLASPQARYLTGVTIPVDGGTSIGF